MPNDQTADTYGSRKVQKDTLFDGTLVCSQFKDGYRFSIDSVLLAHFSEIRKKDSILDLGSGCGVIGLILCYRYRDLEITVTGIERQPDLVRLAQANCSENEFDSMFSIREGNLVDCRAFLEPESYALVVANPPFYSRGTGRVSNNPEALAARHQDGLGLQTFVEAAAFAVQNRGRVAFIYPADQVAELLHCFQTFRLAAKKIQFIYSYPRGKCAALVICEGVKNGGPGTEIAEPCYLYQCRGGPYTEKVESMFHP